MADGAKRDVMGDGESDGGLQLIDGAAQNRAKN